MLKRYWIVLLFSFLVQFYFLPAQSPTYGELLIIRQTGALKSANACHIWLGDSLLMRVENKSCAIIRLPEGSYDLAISLGKGKKNRKNAHIKIEGGKLAAYYCKLFQRKGNRTIPSQGFYFKLQEVHPRMIDKVLKEEFVSNVVKAYLYKKWLETTFIEKKE